MAKQLEELKKVLSEDDVEPTAEPVIDEEPEMQEEPKEEVDPEDMEKFSAMLRESVAEEHEAAANYIERAAKCEEHGFEDAAKILRDIANEEIVHVGEFQALMEKYGILNQEAIDQGEREAEEILSGEKVEPEIDVEEPTAELAEESTDRAFLDKPEIYGRLLSMFDYTVEDQRAVDLLDLIYHFFDVDQLQKFYEYVQEELDMNYEEVFGPKVTEEILDEAYVHKVTQDEWNKTHDDYKMIKNGKKYMVYLDPEAHKTVLGPIEIVDSEEVSEDMSDAEADAFIQKQIAADNSEVRYVVVSLLDGEKDLGPREFSERGIRNIYASYLMDEYGRDEEIPFEEIRNKAWNTPIDDIIEFLNQQGDAEVSIKAEEAGTIASAGEAPTVVAGDGIVEAEPTKICKEFESLLEALKG